MFKNVKIKRILKASFFPLLSGINKIIPKDDKLVLLYSPNRGIEHNIKPLRDYLIQNKYEEKYRILCCVSSAQYYEDDGLTYIRQYKGLFIFLRAKHVFYTTGQIPIKPSKSQIVIHMDHGTTAIKTAGLLTNINNGDDFFFSYYCAPSPKYIDVVKSEFNCDDNNVFINSEPVTDVFFSETEKYDLGDYNKIGLWAPTFRQSDYLGYNDSDREELLPTLIRDDYEEFNELLKENNIKLIVKLHDMQDLSSYDNFKFSNLELYSGYDFQDKGFDLYILMKQIDFLIADYSSVYLQFLLLNKPIGFAIPDLEEYKMKRGFIFDNIQEYMPGNKIYDKHQLFDFIKDIAAGKDEYIEERKTVNDMINYYRDGNSCLRLVKLSEMRD